jgi:hypothetical protein
MHRSLDAATKHLSARILDRETRSPYGNWFYAPFGLLKVAWYPSCGCFHAPICQLKVFAETSTEQMQKMENQKKRQQKIMEKLQANICAGK